ncbi:hypothetical protein EDB84DRAFT_1463550 [Lactarius hengduanensis]|nr:hypothetical protein EDB84DRAFT_1463550 [Lactarius hengduanensis]
MAVQLKRSSPSYLVFLVTGALQMISTLGAEAARASGFRPCNISTPLHCLYRLRTSFPPKTDTLVSGYLRGSGHDAQPHMTTGRIGCPEARIIRLFHSSGRGKDGLLTQ